MIAQFRKWDNDTRITIAQVYIVYTITFIISIIDLGTLYPQFNVMWVFIVYILLLLLSLICHYKCVVTSNAVPEYIKMDMTTYKPCDKCGFGKPERTHHCSKCKECVLCMDHHCLYIANCVGFNNKKYFILLLLYNTLMSSFVVFINSPLAVYAFLYPEVGPMYDKVFRFFDLIHFGAALYSFVLVFQTAPYMLSAVFCNLTTIDLIIKGSSGLLSSHQSQIRNKYDLGVKKNITQIFGNDGVLAFFPTKPKGLTSDGITFEHNTVYSHSLDEQYNEYYEDY
ncbi:palmitoyltransferase PFA3, putative [Entamoeba invadens IP1]|uniref:palmitoyltransferase PFA3, putative n=1 Tax=Entamoeba invadens IP1 TaxID=370355 RepID=UPI0002C3E716|nr:palmitoyltransferase PFA3, putative [Entamoeba invadens IP1]ELP93300.1 palmitoyltransferase PFA3, putative [Entamoeba invadens IP1]|eukprot:XP_004260071.1 palmitoyltransferase PFA3, putative [Entamoeba invadens IP1]